MPLSPIIYCRFLSVKPPYRCDTCGRLVDFKAPKNLPPGIVPPYRCLPPKPTPGAFDFTAHMREHSRVPVVQRERKKRQSSMANYLESLIRDLSDTPSPDIAEEDIETSITRHSDSRNRCLCESEEMEDLLESIPVNKRRRTGRSPLTSSSRNGDQQMVGAARPDFHMDLERHNEAQRAATARAWRRYHRDAPRFGASGHSQVNPRVSRHECCNRSPSLMTQASSATMAPSSSCRNPLYNWRRPCSPELRPGVGYFRRFRPRRDSEFRLDELPCKSGCQASSPSRPLYRPVREKRCKHTGAPKLRFSTSRVPWNPFFSNNYMQMSSVENMRESTERLYGTNTYLGGHKVLPT